MQPLDLTKNQRNALIVLVEHRSLVRSAGGRWSPPGAKTPFFGTKVVSALMEMGIVVSKRDREVAGPFRQTGVVGLASHLDFDDPAERALAVERHIKGSP